MTLVNGDVHSHAPCQPHRLSPACSDACCAPTSEPRKWATGPGAESWPPKYVGWSIVMEWLPCTQTVDARSELAVMLQMAQSASPGAVCMRDRETLAACDVLCCKRQVSEAIVSGCAEVRAKRCMVKCLRTNHVGHDPDELSQQRSFRALRSKDKRCRA